MTLPKKDQKFRISLSRADLVLFQSYLTKDMENIIENAPLLADVQKAIRKIDFQILSPSHEAAPKLLSSSAVSLAEKVKEDSAAQCYISYSEGQTLEDDKIIVAIKYKAETLQIPLEPEESAVLNDYMTKQILGGL